MPTVRKNWKMIAWIILLVFVSGLLSCVQMDESVSIQGRIELKHADVLGIPQSGTLVRIKGTDITTFTDSEGNFSIRKVTLPVEEATLVISKDDYETKEIKVELKKGSVVPVNTVLQYRYGILKVTVSGLGTNDTATVILQKQIETMSEKTTVASQAVKGSSVTYFSKLDDGQYVIKVEANGYYSQEEMVAVTKNTISEKLFNLVKNTGDIEGEIETEDNGPKSGFSVKILNKEEIVIKETLTDDSGKFQIKDILEGEYKITITKTGYVTYVGKITIFASKVTSIPKITMYVGDENTGHLTGKVILNDATIDGNGGITVSAYRAENNELVKTTTTDSYGNFRLALPVGSYKLSFSKQYYKLVEQNDISVESLKIKDIGTIVLQRKVCRVYGQIILPGWINNEGVNVQIGEAQTNTDKEGRYELTVKVGTNQVKISKENYKTINEVLEIKEQESEKEYNKVMEALPSSVEGFVTTDPTGGVVGISVTLQGTTFEWDENEKKLQEKPYTKTTTTDETGKYKLTDIPFGTYEIVFAKAGYESVKLSNIKIMPNEKKVIEQLVTLKKIETEGYIQGKAYLNDAKPDGNAGIIVSIYPVISNTGNFSTKNKSLMKGAYTPDEIMQEETPVVVTLTNEFGNFSAKVPLGEYKITFTKEKYEPVIIDKVEVTTKAVDVGSVQLKRKVSKVFGKITLPGSDDNAGAYVQIGDAYSTTNRDGNYELIAKVGRAIVNITRENYKPFQAEIEIPEQAEYNFSKILEPFKGSVEGFVAFKDETTKLKDAITGGKSITPAKVNPEEVIDVKELINETLQSKTNEKNLTTVASGKKITPVVPKPVEPNPIQPEPIIPEQSAAGIIITLEGTTLSLDNLQPVKYKAVASSDSAGFYKFWDVPFGEYTLEFTSPGYQSIKITGIRIKPNHRYVVPQIIYLDKVPTTGSFYGKVYLEDSKELGGITVLAKKRSGPGYTTTTDYSGTYVFPSVEPGIYDIEFSKFSYQTFRIQGIEIQAGEIKQIEQTPTLKRALGKVVGRINLQGKSKYDGIKVEVLGDYETNIGYRYTGFTDEAGNFEIQVPVNYNFSGLLVQKDDDFEIYRWNRSFTVTESGAFRAFDGETVILKALKNTVKGKARIDKFTNHLNIKVELISKDSEAVYTTYTDEEGNFTFYHIPLGKYIQRTSYDKCGYVLSEVEVIPAEYVRTVDVVLFPNAGTVGGKVTLENGINSEGITIRLEPYETNQEKITYTTKTDAQGNYIFGSVLAGKYKLVAEKTGWNTREVPEVTVEELKDTYVSPFALKDTTPPVITKVLLNGGAQITDQLKVILTTHAQDEGSGVSEILISNTPDFQNANWKSYEFQTEHTLVDEVGERTVYVKVRDRAGNESQIASAKIQLVKLPEMTNLIAYLGGRIITEDKVISKAQSPYYMNQSILVERGVTLRIEPGVVIKFDKTIDGKDVSIIVKGLLIADGAEEGIWIAPYGSNSGTLTITLDTQAAAVITGKKGNIQTQMASKKLPIIGNISTTLEKMIKENIEETKKLLSQGKIKEAIRLKLDIQKYEKEIKINAIGDNIAKNILNKATLDNVNIVVSGIASAEINNSHIGGDVLSDGYVNIDKSTIKHVKGKVNISNSAINAQSGDSISGKILDTIIEVYNNSVSFYSSYLNNVKIDSSNYREWKVALFENSYIENSEIRTTSDFRSSKVSNSKIITNKTIFRGSIVLLNEISITNSQSDKMLAQLEADQNQRSYFVINNFTTEGNDGLRVTHENVLIKYNNFKTPGYAIYFVGGKTRELVDAKNNYYYSTNKEIIKQKIYDFDDDPNFSLPIVEFEPFETEQIQFVSETVEQNDRYLSGNVYKSIKLTKSNSPYEVIDDLKIFGKFEIEPGVVIKVAKDKVIEVYGQFIAEGTEQEPIIFETSSPVLQKGQWQGIRIYNIKNPDIVRLKNVRIKYAGTGINLYGSVMNFKNIKFEQCEQGIWGDSGSFAEIDNISTTNVTSWGIAGNFAQIKVTNSKFNSILYDNYYGKMELYNIFVQAISISWCNYMDVEIIDSNINNFTVSGLRNLEVKSSKILDSYFDVITSKLNISQSEMGNFKFYTFEDGAFVVITQSKLTFNNEILENSWLDSSGADILFDSNEIVGNFALSDGNDRKARYTFKNNTFKNSFVRVTPTQSVLFTGNTFDNSTVEVISPRVVRFEGNTFKNISQNTGGVVTINNVYSSPEFKNNTFYSNNCYAIEVKQGYIGSFIKNYVALNRGGILVSGQLAIEGELVINDNVIMLNREYDLVNNSDKTIVLRNNFHAMYTEDSIKEKLSGNYRLESFRTGIITDAGSSEKPDIGDILTLTNLRDHLVSSNVIDQAHSPYIITSDMTLNNVTITGNVEIRIPDGRSLTFANVSQTSGNVKLRLLYERSDISNITKVNVNCNMNSLSAEGLTMAINSQVNTLTLKNVALEGNGNIGQLNIQEGVQSIIRGVSITKANVSKDLEIQNANISELNASNLNRLKLTNVKLTTVTMSNVTSLIAEGTNIDGLITDSVNNISIVSGNMSNSKIKNAQIVDVTGEIKESEFKNVGKVIARNGQILNSKFNNAPIEIYNVKAFMNEITNAQIGVLVKQADTEDSVYIMKNEFRGNEVDIKSEVARQINAQYNYFADGQAKIQGQVDVSNALSEKPTADYVVLGKEISGKIVLPSIIKASNEPYVIKDNLIVIGELVVEPGVKLLIEVGKKIEVKGTLKMIGTQDKKIILEPNTDLLVKDKWDGIVVSSEGNAHIEWVETGYSTTFLSINGNAVIRNTSIDQCSRAIQINNNQSINVSGLQISNSTYAFDGNIKNISIDKSQILKTNYLFGRLDMYSYSSEIFIKQSNISIDRFFEYLNVQSALLEITDSSIYNNDSSQWINIQNGMKMKLINTNFNASLNFDWSWSQQELSLDNSSINFINLDTGSTPPIINIQNNSQVGELMLRGKGFVNINNSSVNSLAIYNNYSERSIKVSNCKIGKLVVNGSLDGNSSFTDTTFTSSGETFLVTYSSNSSVLFDNCKFSVNMIGESIYTGFYIDKGSIPIIKNSQFNNFKYAIYVKEGALQSFSGNALYRNTYGIYFEKLLTTSTKQRIENNHFQENEYHIYNNTKNEVSANNNYWGTINEVEIKSKNYNVLIDTWLTSSPVGNIEIESTKVNVKWKKQVSDNLMGSLAIYNDKIYTKDNRDLYILDKSGNIILEKGFTDVGDNLNNSIVVDNSGTIYMQRASVLLALTQYGEELWRVYHGCWSSYGVLAIYNKNIYLPGWFDGMFSLVSLDNNGKIVWRSPFGSNSWYTNGPTIAKDGTIYFVYLNDKRLYAFSPDGKVKWRLSFTSYPLSEIAIDSQDNLYVFTDNNYLYKISKSGNILWEKALWGEYWSDSAINSVVIDQNNRVYAKASGKIWALDSNGEILWSVKIGQINSPGILLTSDGTLLATAENRLIALNSSNGEIKWIFGASSNIVGCPAIDESGVVYIQFVDGNLYAVQTDLKGLANSPWPKYRGNLRNTGYVGDNY